MSSEHDRCGVVINFADNNSGVDVPTQHGLHDEAFSFCGVTFTQGLGLILHDAIFNDET
jgi:hypothetical protein